MRTMEKKKGYTYDGEHYSAVEMMRKVVNWADWMDEDFNEYFPNAESLIKAFMHREYDLIDRLDKDDPNTLHDRKMVNRLTGTNYYKV